MIFTEAEIAYLTEHPLGRLATIGPDGAPHVQPVAFWLNARTATIDIGGPDLTTGQKFRNIKADPRVSLVVDDQAPTPNPIGQTGRGIELRGTVEILVLDPLLLDAFSKETLRIRPHRIIAWNIEPWRAEDLTPAALRQASHLIGYNARDVSR